jgi:SAM-dependent methyltransferase
MKDEYHLNKLNDKDIFDILGKHKNAIDEYFWNYYKDSTTNSVKEYIGDICRFAKPSGKVLSIGCGHGINEIFMTDMCKDVETVTGMDIVDVKIASMNAIINILNFDSVSGLIGDGTNLDFSDESFDYLIIIESLSHVDDQYIALKEAIRVLKKGGGVFVLDFNNGANPRILYKCWKENRMKGEIDERPVNPFYVRNRLRELDVSNIIIKPYGFTPFFTSLRQKLFSNRKEIPYWIGLLWTKGFMLKGEKV